MVMGSWFGSAWDAATQDNGETEDERRAREAAQAAPPPPSPAGGFLGSQFSQPAPAPTPPPVGINPIQGGFRQTELQPDPNATTDNPFALPFGAFNAAREATYIPYVTPAIESAKPYIADVINGPGSPLSGLNFASQQLGGPNVGETIADQTPSYGLDFGLNALGAKTFPEALVGVPLGEARGAVGNLATRGLEGFNPGSFDALGGREAAAVQLDRFPGLAGAAEPPINPLGGENVFGPGSRGGSLPVPPPTQPGDLMDTFARSIEARGGTPPPVEPRFPSSYPSIPEGTMGSEFPDVVGQPRWYHDLKTDTWRQSPVKADAPASAMGAPLAYDPQFMTPPPADTAMRDLGLAPTAPVDNLARPDMAQEPSARMEGGGLPAEATSSASPPPSSLTPEVGQLNPEGTGQRAIEDVVATNPNLSDAQKEFLLSPNGQASAAQLGHTEQILGRPVDAEEATAISRRLETPAYSPEGIAERAGVGQAPTRVQALEDAQQAYATRVQEQADRFRAGNGRDMTPTEYQRMAEAERVASGIKPEEVRAGILDWLNLPRSLMTGMDLSFALRQMVLQAPAHPIEWAKSVGTGVKSALSEDYAMQVARRIENSPFKDLHKNLYIAPVEKGAGTIAQREEQYATRLLDRIPILGAIYRPFERGNTAMINQFRADVADNFAKNTLALKGETLSNVSRETQRQIDIYDNFVNRATGRGTLGQLDKSLVPLGQVFFSMRNTIAKPQVIASLASKPFTPAWNQMVKDTAGFFALGATTLYLADSAGLKVGVDPRSSDFGKIRAGDTHIDIWGGWQQQARAVFQAVQGARGESNFVNGAGKESTKSPLQVALPWVGNRASPQAGLVGQGLRALLENKTDGGLVLDGLRQMFPDYRAPGLNAATAFNYLTPLSIQDTADAIKSEGIKGGLLAGPLAFFGVGVQTYPDTSNPRTAAVNNVMAKPENLAGLPPNVAAFLQDKSWNEATPKEQRAILEKLSPEEQAAIAKGEQTLRDKKDIFQLSRDEAKARAELADQQRAALQPIADKLLQDWKTGAMPPEKALEAIKRVEAAADKEAQFSGNVGPKLSESQAYKDAVKGIGGDKTPGQQEVDRIREIQGKYYAIYDDPRVTNPDGSKNWDKITAAQNAIMDTLRKQDPGFATRVEFNLQKNPESDFELTKWISKIDDRLNQAGYYDVPSGQKTQFARTHPDVDALVSLKYGNPVHSEEAAKILRSLAPERKVAYAK